MAAACIIPVPLSAKATGGNHVKNCGNFSSNMLSIQSIKPMRSSRSKRDLSVRADYKEDNSGGGDGFVAGFVLGGAVVGSLALVLGPKIWKASQNKNEFVFTRPRAPLYYAEGPEKWKTLRRKIGQLNSAIEKVSSRFRGGSKVPGESLKIEPDGVGVGYY